MRNFYETRLFRLKNGKFLSVILANGNDTSSPEEVVRKVFSEEIEAIIWLDDELSRLETGRGLWE